MKNITLSILAIFFLGCNSENALDCLQTTGDPVTKTYELPPFEEIFTYARVKLYLKDGVEQKVVVKTGENLLEEVKFSVNANRLTIKNENGCNLVRGYETVKVYVTSPNLTFIQNGSQWTVESLNTLHYPELRLVSEDEFHEDEYHTDGDFKLELDCEELTIVNTNISNYFLSGEVENMFAGFYSGDGRLDAPDLIVQHFNFFHRGSNVFIVNPQQSIEGEIRSTGDVISLNEPPVVEVEEFYTGRLIFQVP